MLRPYFLLIFLLFSSKLLAQVQIETPISPFLHNNDTLQLSLNYGDSVFIGFLNRWGVGDTACQKRIFTNQTIALPIQKPEGIYLLIIGSDTQAIGKSITIIQQEPHTLYFTLKIRASSYPVQAGEVLLFPNPLTTEPTLTCIWADTASQYTFEVYNTLGEIVHREVGEKTFMGTVLIPAHTLSAGMYVAVLYAQQRRYTVKFVKNP